MKLSVPLFLLAAACGGPPAATVAKLGLDESACVQAYDSGAAIDACRAAARADFCAKYPGVDARCPNDGGAE
jgi:hypothetical protein